MPEYIDKRIVALAKANDIGIPTRVFKGGVREVFLANIARTRVFEGETITDRRRTLETCEVAPDVGGLVAEHTVEKPTGFDSESVPPQANTSIDDLSSKEL